MSGGDGITGRAICPSCGHRIQLRSTGQMFSHFKLVDGRRVQCLMSGTKPWHGIETGTTSDTGGAA